jgi:hypothetical protein
MRLAGVVANMRKNQRKRNSAGKKCKTAFEISARDALNKLARVHMQRTSSGAGGRLLLDALCFPSPDLLPIHNSISWRAAP